MTDLQRVVDGVVTATPGVTWSICVVDGGREVARHDPDRRLSTASIGKLLLLAETARQIERGTLDPDERLSRNAELAVADSGLWQHLRQESLAVVDVAVLIASVSDNYATNVLLERVGLDAVGRLAGDLGLRRTALTDRVRGTRRTAGDPPGLSFGSAGELAALMHRVAARALVSPGVSDQLDRWLATGVDLSMVASAVHLDPLAHMTADRGIVLRNKTGTDDGIRADVGYLRGPEPGIAYAVLANWDATGADARDGVMRGMQRIGAALSMGPTC
jgi:beta-lactamase class A